MAHSLRLTVIHAIAWCISSMAACYSSEYLDRLWQLLFEDSGSEGAAELDLAAEGAHGVWLSDVLKESFDPPAHDSGSAAVDGSAADVHVIPYDPDPSQTQPVMDEPGTQEPGFTLFHMWSVEPQKPDTPDSQDTQMLQQQEEGRKQAQRLRERIAEEEAASKRARLTHARLDDALDEVFL